MDLPVMPPVAPMLSKAASSIPSGDGWLYDPKWDGFRSIAFRDGDEVVLGSRNEKPLTRYFPELVEAFLVALPERPHRRHGKRSNGIRPISGRRATLHRRAAPPGGQDREVREMVSRASARRAA